jgi:hypothetical protein
MNNATQPKRKQSVNRTTIETMISTQLSIGKDMSKALVRLVEQLSTSTEENTNLDRLNSKELFRALLLNRERCDATIELAIRRYSEVFEDLAKSTSHFDVQNCESAQFIGRILNRYRVYHLQDLQLLGVAVVEVFPGVSVDPQVHEVIGKIPTTAPSEVETIAKVHTPIFRWKDSFAQPQLKAAKVVIFEGENSSEEGASE